MKVFIVVFLVIFYWVASRLHKPKSVLKSPDEYELLKKLEVEEGLIPRRGCKD